MICKLKVLVPALWLLLSGCTTEVKNYAEFKEPSIDYRPHPLWFWNNATVTREGIDAQILALRDSAGYGGMSILPFGRGFKPEYLSDEYFELYAYTVKRAAELGLKVTFYDEYGFPSGSAGAINGDDVPRFMNRFPDLTIKRLDKLEQDLKGGESYLQPTPAEGVLMGVVAMNMETFERIDLTGTAVNDTIRWVAPEGEWKVMQFVCVKDGDPNMDYLSVEAAQAFIEMVHEEYYRRMPDYFVSTITHTFFDELTLYRAQGRVWTPRFNEIYQERYGESPVLLYPALWYEIGEETQSARNALFSFRSDLYAEAYTKEVDEWSRAHGIKATGHQDNEEVVNPVGTSGDLMKCFRYLEIPGIDKIGPHNDRPAEKFYKIVSSSAYNWDHSYVMAETYGLLGDLSVDSLQMVAMDQFVKGINRFIPHAAWYDDQNVTFKPELSSRNPIYKDSLYRFNTVLARLQYMLQDEARVVADVAVVYPIHTMQGDHYFDGPFRAYEGGVKIPYLDYVEVGEALSNVICRDFIWLHPEVLASQCTVNAHTLHLNNRLQYNSFGTLIIPASRTISVSTLEQVVALFESGGRVIFTSLLPTQSAERGQDGRIAELMSRLLPASLKKNENPQGGSVLFLEELTSETLAEALRSERPADVSFRSGTPYRYIHKEQQGQSLYYFVNFTPHSSDTEVVLRGEKRLEAWDPHTGETAAVAVTHEKQGAETVTRLKLGISGRRSLFLVEK